MSTQRYREIFNRELNRRKFIVHGAAAGAAVALGPTALTLAQDTIDPTNWTPEYITSIAGTLEVDTAAECAKVVPLDTRGKLTYWYVGPNQASRRIEHEIDEQFWDGLRGDLSEHHGRQAEPRLQRDARQAAHRRARQGGADGGATADPVGRRVRRQGPAARVRPGGGRLHGRRVLAGRAEVGHLEGQDLRRADQQRDDGA